MARVPTWVVAGTLAVLVLALALTWGWLFPWHGTYALYTASHELVQAPLVASLLDVALLGAWFWLGGVGWSELGLTRRDLPRGVAVLAIAYAGVQLGLLGLALVGGDGIHAGRAVLEPADAIGAGIAQLFGVTLVEEVVFRGFLMRQIVLRTRTVFTGVALAAIPFALWHIPHRLSIGLTGIDLAADLVFDWAGGVVASYIYLRGGNLLVVVALHTLFNTQAPLLASQVSPQLVFAPVSVAVVIWLELDRRRARR